MIIQTVHLLDLVLCKAEVIVLAPDDTHTLVVSEILCNHSSGVLSMFSMNLCDRRTFFKGTRCFCNPLVKTARNRRSVQMPHPRLYDTCCQLHRTTKINCPRHLQALPRMPFGLWPDSLRRTVCMVQTVSEKPRNRCELLCCRFHKRC